MRILIDTNIIIDILEKREPYFEESYKVLRKCLEEGIECLVTASAATDIFYLLRKFFRSSRMAKDYLEQLFWLVTFADVQALDIQNTLRNVRKKTPSYLQSHNSHDYIYENWH